MCSCVRMYACIWIRSASRIFQTIINAVLFINILIFFSSFIYIYMFIKWNIWNYYISRNQQIAGLLKYKSKRRKELKKNKKELPFAKWITSPRILSSRLQISGFFNKNVQSTTTPIFSRFRSTLVIGAQLTFLLLCGIRWYELQADDYFTFVSDWIVEWFCLYR